MLISRYIFRQTASALITILVSLTLIVWLTSVLKEIKLLTSEGQTFILFLKITSLAIPSLIVTVAPIAFLIATLHTLNRLNGDSELIVLSATGASPWRTLTPYATLGIIVSAAVLAANMTVIPGSARLLADYIAKVRADLLSQVLQPGEFTDMEPGLTFHMRDKGKDGQLIGVVVHDERDPKMTTTVVADRGDLTTEGRRSTMELQDGQIIRQEAGKQEAQIVVFKSYAFDIGDFSAKGSLRESKPRERDIRELLFPPPGDPYFENNKASIRSEIHERFSGALYALVFAVLAVVYLGRPRTTREGRGGILFTAFTIGAAIRVTGIAGVNMVGKNLGAAGLIYGVPAAALVLGLIMLRFNIGAPVIGLPSLRLPLPNWLQRRGGRAAAPRTQPHRGGAP
jgi:lipopolysaccharide export system permease protein